MSSSIIITMIYPDYKSSIRHVWKSPVWMISDMVSSGNQPFSLLATEAQSLVRVGPWRLYSLSECLAGVPWKRDGEVLKNKTTEGWGGLEKYAKIIWSDFLKIWISQFSFGLCNVLCVYLLDLASIIDILFPIFSPNIPNMKYPIKYTIHPFNLA